MARLIAALAVLGLLGCDGSSGNGDITSVTATSGGGLTGGATRGPASLGMSTSCSSTQVLAWDGNSWECAANGSGGAGDIEGVTAGAGLINGGTSGTVTLDVACGSGMTCNANDVTLNLAVQDCSAGQFFDSNTATGAFTCVAEVGDVSSVVAGTALVTGGTSGAVTVDVACLAGGGLTCNADDITILTTCTDGQILKWDDGGSAWECADDDSGAGGAGDITGVVAGAGLTGGATSGTATVDVACGAGITCAADAISADYTPIGTCSAGSSIRDIAADGTVTCETDTDTDTDTTYSEGTGIDITGTVVSANLAVQNCSAGEFFDSNTATGTFSCVAEVGDISSIVFTAGGGMSSSGTTTSSGAATVGLNTGCSTNQILKWNGTAWACAADADTGASGGDITSVVAGTGLTGGATSGAATLDIGCGSNMSCGADSINLANSVTIADDLTVTDELTAPELYTSGPSIHDFGMVRWSNGTATSAATYDTAIERSAANTLVVTDATGTAESKWRDLITRNFYADFSINVSSGAPIRWSSTTSPTGSADTGIGRNTAGVVEINNGTLGTLRDLYSRSIVTDATISVGDYIIDSSGTATLSGCTGTVVGGDTFGFVDVTVEDTECAVVFPISHGVVAAICVVSPAQSSAPTGILYISARSGSGFTVKNTTSPMPDFTYVCGAP